MTDMKWIEQYKDENGTLMYSHELILADIIKELVEEMRLFRRAMRGLK